MASQPRYLVIDCTQYYTAFVMESLVKTYGRLGGGKLIPFLVAVSKAARIRPAQVSLIYPV
ncbi:hypothetical protein [Methyloglobulus sp.]|uniref:hypothetical protein n=1 Tax=Methyloglobulus sp. TaxID=2518622 RepID=UPI001813AE94|nr:hypothetical protein [Methyloglobulus sp.]